MTKMFSPSRIAVSYTHLDVYKRQVIKVQQAEISEMKQLLKPLGGIEKSAYDPMKESMTHMLDEGADMNANMRFVKLMLPHHAMAVEMALPALVYSDNPKVLDLAEAIIIEQAKDCLLYTSFFQKK